MSAKSKMLIALVAAVAVVGLGVVVVLNLISVDSSEDAGVLFETVQSTPPDNRTCLDQDGGRDSAAKELINIVDAVVATNNGARVMSDDEWSEYSPPLPNVKNRDRTKLFDDYCLYRSPGAPGDCEGEDCRGQRQLGDFDWLEVSLLLAQDCFPSPSSHETEGETPDLNPALPEGWTLDRVELDEPLDILPFGGDDACFHNVVRDNLGQGYHQYVFAYDSYPPNP